MSEAKGLAALVPSDPRMPRMIVKMHTLPAHLKEELMVGAPFALTNP
jgi:hypothetical protein